MDKKQHDFKKKSTYKNNINNVNNSTQNKFISTKYKNQQPVKVKTVDGEYEGEMLEFDSFTILIKEVDDTKVLIFKNNIIAIK
jgi:sRNA-binding regulator protein Hfq